MKVSNYVRTAEAAKILGVSPGIVRNWADRGKLRSRRLPQNGYRLFLKKDLEAVLGALHRSGQSSQPSRRSTGRNRA